MNSIQTYMNNVVETCKSTDQAFINAQNVGLKALSIKAKLEVPETSNDAWVAGLNNEAILSFQFGW